MTSRPLSLEQKKLQQKIAEDQFRMMLIQKQNEALWKQKKTGK
jgi:hypothetical protein